jgi:RNA polymerase sigma factor for flagellar operon FliA
MTPKRDSRAVKGRAASPVSNEDIALYMPLVRRLVARFVARLPRSVQRDDLVAAGTYGLVDALSKNPGQRGLGFRSYAELRVRGAIVDELRAHDWLSRSARKPSSGGPDPGVPRLSAVIAFEDLPKATRDSLHDPQAASPLAAAELEDQREAVAAAVGVLLERDRMILHLFYFQGVQLQEIAAKLGVSKPRASQLHSRAIARLRSTLGPAFAS